MLTIRIKLNPSELAALREVAERELRLPPEQVRHIVRQELVRRGVLSISQTEVSSAQPADPLAQAE